MKNISDSKIEEAGNNKQQTSQSLLRQWKILATLKVGSWTGTRTIKDVLELEGFKVTLRTVQRDLVQLAQSFPIEGNQSTPQGWRWKKEAPILSLPQMSSSQAITFMMVEAHLKHLLPPSLLQEIAPWFMQAHYAIGKENNSVKHWLDHVRIIPATQPLIPPEIEPSCQQAIYEALLRNKQIRATYQKRGQDTAKAYTLNPLAIVQRGAIIYVLCTKANQTDIRMFALHRFKTAICTDEVLHKPKQFDIDEYIASGALGFAIPQQLLDEHQLKPHQVIDLQFECSPHTAYGLLESPLSANQTITTVNSKDIASPNNKMPDTQPLPAITNKVQVNASVPLTAQLVWWLRGFGNQIEVTQPVYLKQWINENTVALNI